MPIYRCKGKDCGFSTDDLGDFVTHVVRENLPKETALPPTGEEEVLIRHRKVEDYLNCPECRPKFDEAYKKMGWAPQPKPEEKKAEGGLGI